MSGYRYTGEGTHYEVPARDLTAEEFDALDPMQQRIVRLSPAYSELSAAEAKKAADAAAKAEEAERKRAEAKSAADGKEGQ